MTTTTNTIGLTAKEQDLANYITETVDDLYARAGALDDERRTLLIEKALVKCMDLFEQVAFFDAGEAAALGMVGHAITGLAGATLASLRKEKGFTANGDGAVDDLFIGIKDMVSEITVRQMPEEVQADARAFQARLAEGDMDEKTALAQAQALSDRIRGTAPAVPTAEAEVKDRYDTGLYL